VSMSQAKLIEKEISALSAKIKVLSRRRDRAIKNTFFRCHVCNKRTKIGRLVYIQAHWYTEPYSCTAGDYWTSGEGQVECPKCGNVNGLNSRPDVVAKKHFFKKVVKTYVH